MRRTAYALALSIGAMIVFAMPGAAADARAQITAVVPCPACGYREAAAAYRRAARSTTGVWNTYFVAMADYHDCVATKLRADAGGCGEAPRTPVGSPCDAPTARAISLCNATEPPENASASFVALPDSVASVELRATAAATGGAVRYVWDALRERGMPAGSAPLDSVREHRAQTDSTLSGFARDADRGAPADSLYRAALDDGIALLNRASTGDDPDAYVNALRLVAYADSVRGSPEAKFVMGILTYQIGDFALQAAWQVRNCSVVLLASDALSKSDDYLLQNGGIAPRNAMRLRESLLTLRANAKELVERRCL
jgi:hypothetical protein